MQYYIWSELSQQWAVQGFSLWSCRAGQDVEGARARGQGGGGEGWLSNSHSTHGLFPVSSGMLVLDLFWLVPMRRRFPCAALTPTSLAVAMPRACAADCA
jgi:hypothetical protein